MRAAPLLLLALAGCQAILGIEDPSTGAECDPYAVDQGCDDGETCDVDGNDGSLVCRDIGTGDVMAFCGDDVPCASDLSCVDGVCRSICEGAADCDPTREELCIRDYFDIRVCDSACDVLSATPTCPTGLECILFLNDSGNPLPYCVPLGYFGGLPLDMECTFLSACDQTLGCYDDDSDGTGECTELCSAAAPCPDGRTCNFVLNAPVHEVNIGLCSRP